MDGSALSEALTQGGFQVGRPVMLAQKVAEGFLGQFLKGHQDRIVERGEDSVAVIEMSPESWFVVGIVPGISRAPLQKLHRWREEASTWLWPVNVGAYVD